MRTATKVPFVGKAFFGKDDPVRPRKGTIEGSRQDALIEASARLFFERGFDRTTVRDIAHAAGITSGSIFYHFQTKEEILAAIIEIGMRRGMGDIAKSLEGVTGARARLHMLILSHLRALHGPHGHYHHIWLREMRILPAEKIAGLKTIARGYRDLWRGVVGEAIATGLVRSDRRIFRRVAIGALNWTTFWLRNPDDAKIVEVADHIVATLLNEASPSLPDIAEE